MAFTGHILTENQIAISEVNVQAVAQNPLTPSYPIQLGITDSTGYFDSGLFVVPLGTNTVLKPYKNDNHLNGVSTYDLLLISKHILGVTTLNSPYKMIAADVNKSGSITTFDIVELRKMILGIYNELPANTSWRFVEKSFVFPIQSNPFSIVFPEVKLVSSIQITNDPWTFVGMKIGDINNSAIAHFQNEAEERNSKPLPFSVQNQTLEKGKTYTIHFDPEDMVEGYQFTLEYPNLDLIKLTPSEGMEADNFAIFKEKNLLTTSFIGNKKGEFDLTFEAEKDGQLSDFLKISSQITKAESYTIEGEQKGVELRFLPKKETNSPVLNLEITPNPIIDEAFVTFNLPEKSVCTLSVFDNLGRLLLEEKKEFLQGENTFSFKPESKGILYFQVETPFGKEMKKVFR
jgi:large repetitive protein